MILFDTNVNLLITSVIDLESNILHFSSKIFLAMLFPLKSQIACYPILIIVLTVVFVLPNPEIGNLFIDSAIE